MTEAPMTLREEQKLLTRRKLVEAARTVFEQNGYANSAIDEITRRAGASRATFYLHFENKPAILLEVFRTAHLEPVLAAMDQLDTEVPLSKASIRNFINDYVGIYDGTRGVMRAWIQGESQEGSSRKSVSDELRGAFLDVMSEKISVIRRKAGLKVSKNDSRMRALLMFAQIERFCFYTSLRNVNVDTEKAMDLMAAAWEQLISA
ncbi:TetR/AcrR family transcriptional regulator [Rhodococcus koreensis]